MHLHEKNQEGLSFVARWCGMEPETLLNLIVAVALEELKNAPSYDEVLVWERDTEVAHG